jgi:sulfur-carrier protein
MDLRAVGHPVARVRLFAALREIAGTSSVEVEGATVGEVVSALGERFGPRFLEIVGAGSVVVDGERATLDRPLDGEKEVALLPPVAGGSGR